MKKFNFIYLLLALVGVFAMTSCEHKYADYTPGAQDANMGAYLPSTADFEVTAETTSVDIVVARINTAEAADVNVRAEDVTSSDLFTFPKGVSFAAGADEAKFTVEFDGSKLEVGKEYAIRVQIDQAEASNYATSEYIYTIMVPEPWTSMGEGIYFDDLLWWLLDGGEAYQGNGAYVEFQQHALEPNRLRAVNVYAPATIGAMWGGVPQFFNFTAGDATTYVDFDITDPNNVKFGETITIPDAGDAQVAYLNISVVGDQQGNVYDLACLVWADAGPVVLKDGVISFPTSGVELAAFYGGQYAGYFAQGNTAGYLQYYLPGTEFVNYEMAVSYDGMYVSADGATAEAIFNFALGSDVASYKFAFVPDDITADPSATIEAIVAGSSDLKIFESDAETKRWEVELTKGVYTLVAVPYSVDGEAQVDNALVYNFYFNGTGDMPEVNIDVELGVPSQLVAAEKAEEVEANMPAPYYIGVKLTADATQLKAIKFWYGNKASVEQAGLTIDQLFADYAGDASAWIQRLAENDGVMIGGFNVVNGSANTVFLRFETIYGTHIDYISEEPYVTPAYDGDFYIGQYAFQDGEGENVSQQVFGVIPGKSYNDFFFTHPMIDGSQWYATLDTEAATFTVTGVERGYEKYDNQYGGGYGYFDKEGTQIYGYFSFASEESDGTDPMVFTVENNQLVSLNTTFQMVVFNAADGTVLGQYFSFTPTTTIAPYSQDAGVAAKALSASSSKKAALLTCDEAVYVGAGVAVERELVIEATPLKSEVNFSRCAATVQR